MPKYKYKSKIIKKKKNVYPQQSDVNNESWKDLLKDGYILLITFAICLTSSAMAILEPFLPIWLIEIIDPEVI